MTVEPGNMSEPAGVGRMCYDCKWLNYENLWCEHTMRSVPLTSSIPPRGCMTYQAGLGNFESRITVSEHNIEIKEVDEKDLSVKITYHVDMPDLSKKLSDELDELLLHEIAIRRGYVKERVCHDDGRGVFRCDRCGVFVRRTGVSDCSGSVPIRYCPNCGAKVVGE